MPSKPFTSQSLILLFLLCTSLLPVSAKIIIFQPKRMDRPVTTYVHVEVVKNLAKTDAQARPALVTEKAKEAFRSLKREVPQSRWPDVVTALWTGGDKLYLASSAKGSGEVAKNDPAVIPPYVHSALDLAHNHDWKCGEIMVLAEWFRKNKGKGKLPQDKMIVTVDRDGTVMSPCSQGQKGAGQQFLLSLGFAASQIVTPSQQYQTPAYTSTRTGIYPAKMVNRRALREWNA